MKRYSDEEKEMILKKADEIGVTATCKEEGINPNTIYRWKREKTEVEKPSEETIDKAALQDLIAPTAELEARIQALESENAVLRERNEKLRRMVIALASV